MNEHKDHERRERSGGPYPDDARFPSEGDVGSKLPGVPNRDYGDPPVVDPDGDDDPGNGSEEG